MDGGGTEQVNGNCEVCGKSNKCIICEKAFFCFTDHDNTGLENHMQACKPYQIYSYGEQRYIVATRPIEEGTVILEELLLVMGPNETPQVCLGCFKILDTRTTYPCMKCGWRLCSVECQFNPVHSPECYYLSKKGDGTNKHDVPITTPYPAAIYELSSVFEHNCSANCYKAIDSQGVLRIIAGVSIPKGQRLSICYTNPLWTTSCRKSNLEERYLKCKCERCMDITERLTYMSAVNCYDRTCIGLLLPLSFENSKSVWVCNNNCVIGIPWNAVHVLLKELMEELASFKIRNDCDGIKMCLEKNKTSLSKWHSCMIQAKLVLLEMLGGLTTESMCTISIEDLWLKESLCRQLVEILRVIAPAEKKIFGNVYYNLHLALEEMYRRKILSGEAAQGCVKEILNEVVKCLKYESAITKEGRLCAEALRKLNILDEVV